ncbi:MAG: corrinoid activation/regeneration protein AcsV [Treponema sp.]|nr:corrinoid activation/regeneration protein AcsV [Treponema sp.]
MEKTYRILFKTEQGIDQSIDASPGESLPEAARRAGIALDAPCGGNGTCGKCRVRVLNGSVAGGQSRHITPQEFNDGWRLACISSVCSDAAILVPETAGAYECQIRAGGKDSTGENIIFQKLQTELTGTGIDSGIKIVKAELEEPSPDNPMADRERLLRRLAELTHIPQQDMTLSALRKLPSVLRVNNFSVYCVLRLQAECCSVIDIFPGTGDMPVIAGLAADIGTTTVSAMLVDLANGNVLAFGSAGNGQIRYGADVISRIIASSVPAKDSAQSGLEQMRLAVTAECITPLIARICETAAISAEHIYRAAIAANTTMTHLFMGVDPAYLRLEPYTPAFFESGTLRGADIGLPLHPDTEAVIAPAIGSYVGGDITAGVYASSIFSQPEISLLVDLGTNGELVLGNAEFLMSCACSAGPAFEGGDISCGMRATDGAIEACTIDPETMEPAITVIGEAGLAKGLCGSGLIDLVGELFRCGIINAKGKIIKDGKRIRRDDNAAYIIAFTDEAAGGREISITETDIDNFIRAKGAIFSAIQTMLAALDFDIGMIDNVFIAGGIGSGINIRQAVRIGMLPNISPEKYRYIGNSSLHGAYAMLVSKEAALKIEKIGRDMTYIELSTHPGYMDELIAACFLPHTNGGLFENIE